MVRLILMKMTEDNQIKKKWACVYFSQDASLTVVSRESPKLVILVDFTVMSDVDMEWKVGGATKMFRGVIVKTHGEYYLILV